MAPVALEVDVFDGEAEHLALAQAAAEGELAACMEALLQPGDDGVYALQRPSDDLLPGRRRQLGRLRLAGVLRQQPILHGHAEDAGEDVEDALDRRHFEATVLERPDPTLDDRGLVEGRQLTLAQLLNDVVADRRLIAQGGRRADGVRVEPLLRVGPERLLRRGRDDVGAVSNLDVDLGGAVVRLGRRVEVFLALAAVQVALTDLPALADAVVGGGDH